LQQDVAFEADAVDQLELGFEEIDLLLFAFENIAEEIARDEISDSLAMRDRLAQPREAGLFEAQITFEDWAGR
jgi:hypothetical protein